MTMLFNGTELEEVRFNGVDCEKVYFNGVLVFEKATNERMMTVGTIQSGAWGEYGYRRGENVGDVTPNILVTPLGEYSIEHIYWSGAGGDTPMSFIGLEPIGSSPRFWDHYALKVHIAGHTIDFSSNNYNGFTYLSYELFALLPKSGKHSIILEVIP